MKAKVTLPSVVMAAISTVVGITATPNLSAHADKATIESCIQHPTGHSLNINDLDSGCPILLIIFYQH